MLHISLDTGKVKQGHKACIKEINSKIHTQRTYENRGHSETSNRPEHTDTISVDAALNKWFCYLQEQTWLMGEMLVFQITPMLT